MVAAAALLVVPTLACAAAPSFRTLLALRALQGAFIPGVAAVSVAYAGDRYPGPRLAQVVAGIMAAAVAGGLAGRVMSGPVTAAFGWRVSFVVAASFTALPRWDSARARARAAAPALRLARRLWRGPRPPSRLAARRRLPHRRRALLRLDGALHLPAFHLASPRYRLPTALVSSVYLVYAAGIIASPLAGRLARTVPPRLIMGAGLAAGAVGALATLAGPLPVVVVGLVIFVAAHTPPRRSRRRS